MHLVFVYGTLRPSLRKVHDKWPWLPVEEEKGSGTIYGRLFKLTDTVPGVLFTNRRGEGAGKVVGEVVSVDDTALKGFDQLEGHPRNYKRQLVEVTMDNGAKLEAWCYEYPHIRKGDPYVAGGDWAPVYLEAVGHG